MPLCGSPMSRYLTGKLSVHVSCIITCAYHYGCTIIPGKFFLWLHCKHFVYLVDTQKMYRTFFYVMWSTSLSLCLLGWWIICFAKWWCEVWVLKDNEHLEPLGTVPPFLLLEFTTHSTKVINVMCFFHWHYLYVSLIH